MAKSNKLQENVRGVLEPFLSNLQNDLKSARKFALQGIRTEIFDNEDNKDCDLSVVFPEIYAYILKSFSDSSEVCRETAINIIINFIERLPINDYYLTYILPVLVRRIGCPEIVEESEELRLLLIILLRKIIEKYGVTQLLVPFTDEFKNILCKTCADPYPKVKIEACKCIILFSQAIKRDFHYQSESYIKPVLSNFAHQQFRVRVAAVKAIGAIVVAGNAKCFELSITPMAEKLFDENSLVRLEVTLEVGNWMLQLRDRYSYWHRMIPLLLTSLSDVMTDIRETATTMWDKIGLQYLMENEEDLKKKIDFLTDVPLHYPDVKRPNLGCRVLVQSNIGKIVPAIGREMDGWQADARLRSAQLLCWLILCSENGCTQHANTIIHTLLRGAKDEDKSVVVEMKRASEIFAHFISPPTWWKLLESELDSWSTLLVVSHMVKGSQSNGVRKVMKEICAKLADPDRCQTKKAKYQTNILRVTESLMSLCGESCQSVANLLFTINFSVYAMPASDKVQFMALSNLDKLRSIEDCGSTLTTLYDRHICDILSSITEPLDTPHLCLLECTLLRSGYALGNQLHLIAPLLNECLATPKTDPDVKLRMFTSLSTMLQNKQTNFKNCEKDKLEAFLKIIIEDIILPNLVWSPGRTAEAIRTAAVACLCSTLQETPSKEREGEGDNDDVVNLFPTKESLEPVLDKIVPLLVSLVDDNSVLTRQHSLRAVCYLATLANTRDCFNDQTLHKLYFVVLKRLDDCNDKVRSIAVETLCCLFKNRPQPYDVVVYNAHIDAVYSAMLVHLDDSEEGFRKEMLDALIAVSDVDPKLLEKKIKANIQLYRNKFATSSCLVTLKN